MKSKKPKNQNERAEGGSTGRRQGWRSRGSAVLAGGGPDSPAAALPPVSTRDSPPVRPLVLIAYFPAADITKAAQTSPLMPRRGGGGAGEVDGLVGWLAVDVYLCPMFPCVSIYICPLYGG